jgi:DNA-binding MarR family transcriptional regulator
MATARAAKQATKVTPPNSDAEPARTWTFFTNHAHVLFLLAREPDVRLREVADRVGITERAVQRIVSELAAEGYLTVKREGRRNHYRIAPKARLRHPIEGHCTVGELLGVVLPHEE